MGKSQYIKKRKSKEKNVSEDYSFYIPYLPDMKRRFLKNSIKWFLIVLFSWLIWFMCFIYYPLTTMVDIKGKVTYYRFLSTGKRTVVTDTHFIKMDTYASPIIHKESITFFNGRKTKIKIGDILIVQIQKKDLEKLNNYTETKPLSEYSKWEVSKFPRFYGIKHYDKIIVSSEKALWNFPTPATLGGILKFVCEFLVLLMIAALYVDGKKLYKINQWVKANT